MMNKVLKSSTVLLSYLALQTSAWAVNTNYRIEIIETPEEFKSSFPVGINNQGDVVSTLATLNGNRFNYPVDRELLDFKDEDNLENFTTRLSSSYATALFYATLYWDSIQKGRFVSESLGATLTYLATYNKDGQHQQLAPYRTAFSDRSELEELAIFDEENPETDEYYYYNTELSHGINNLGWLAGEAGSPLTETRIDGETWLIPSFLNRGFVRYSNKAILLEPLYDEEDALGGFSYATDISDNGYVVGYASVDGSTSLNSLIDTCRANDDSVPKEVCIWKSLGDNKTNQFSAFKTRAYLWKVNGNGEVASKRELGIAIDDPEYKDSLSFISRAFAVNDAGIAVGESHVIDVNDRTRQQAVIFFENNVFPMTNPLEYRTSRAIDINNNGIVIGTLTDSSTLVGVTKSFYYDIDSGGVTVTKLNDFFSSANTKVNSINDQNIIVGNTEASALASGSKPKHGFVYDLDTEEMYDLNDLLSCKTDFTITDAVDVNDDGVILARASYVQARRNLLGQIVADVTTGDAAIEQVEYTVKLIPDASSADSCESPDNEEKVKRKGASFNAGWFVLLFITFLFKKRNIKSKKI
ncbi:DUF3466 family protein [Catenovulum sp. 2E275]|uniref:DUF3466 family protein n=1 Tax=Catenovulum sp. 2E275 TaxID=2980497 RepID=UPI0021D3216E|nr:DUF3466 family protein [Catenovulum sp. 2E275]MCU4674453.1 DUF3466 family protein [Catenovulum sp. 2E275]